MDFLPTQPPDFPWQRILLWIPLGALLSAVLTGIVHSYARRHLLDLPNARSSHKGAVPRGGGVSIVLCLLGALIILYARGALTKDLFMALQGGWLIAIVGFWDDHGHVAPVYRLVAHIVAAVWTLFWFPDLSALGWGAEGWLGPAWSWPVAGLFVVWMLNLFNFMDGIDGIAGVEAAFVALSGVFLLSVGHAIGHGSPGSFDSALVLAILAGGCIGFLVWNWPPARIFMGDVGSGFIGYTLGAMAVFTAVERQLSLTVWLILSGVFLVDATLTLLRRLMTGQRWYAAHRSHAYQHAAQWLGSHRAVTVSVLAVNLTWLLPLAWAALQWPQWEPLLLGVAYFPLISAALLLRAGRPNQS